MSVNEKLMAPGTFSVNLNIQSTPNSVINSIVPWGNIVLTPTRISPEEFTDAQIRGFLSLLVTIITTLWLYRMITQDVSASTALREVIFNTTSLLTGTGYASSDYGQWGNFAICPSGNYGAK